MTPEEFFANTDEHPNGCWEWRGRPVAKTGYARLKVGGRQWRAHRYAYTLTRGSIPDGLDVLHICDNRMCVRPDHLFLGTDTDNMRDMSAKGRAAGFRRNGERHPMVKLSDEQIKEYRRRWVRAGRYGNGKVLAAEAGMNYSHFIRLLAGTGRLPTEASR